MLTTRLFGPSRVRVRKAALNAPLEPKEPKGPKEPKEPKPEKDTLTYRELPRFW